MKIIQQTYAIDACLAREKVRFEPVTGSRERKNHSVKIAGSGHAVTDSLTVSRNRGISRTWNGGSKGFREKCRFTGTGSRIPEFPEWGERMNREITLPEAAEKIGATVDQLRYWISLMEIESTRRGKCRYLAEEDVSRLHAMAELVQGGAAPKDAAAQVRTSPISAAIVIPQPENDVVGELKKAFLLMVEENRQMKLAMNTVLEEVKAIRAENGELRGQVAMLLPAPKAEDEELLRKLNEPPRPIAVWKPEPVNNDPLEGLGMIRRTWVKLVHPEMMRRKAA